MDLIYLYYPNTCFESIYVWVCMLIYTLGCVKCGVSVLFGDNDTCHGFMCVSLQEKVRVFALGSLPVQVCRRNY